MPGKCKNTVHTDDPTELAMECGSLECVIELLSGTEYLIPWTQLVYVKRDMSDAPLNAIVRTTSLIPKL